MQSAKNQIFLLFQTFSKKRDALLKKIPFFKKEIGYYEFEEVDKVSTPGFIGIALRVGLVVVIAGVMIIVITKTSVKVHSESDVSYRQESLLAEINTSQVAEINPNPPGVEEFMAPVGMSYEVDKITPTPTPIVDASSNDIWLKLAQCESKQNWGIDSGNGYYGGLQFSLGAWVSVGGSGKPSDASKDEQIMRGKLLQAKRGWGPWGGCSKKLGLL